MADVRDLVLTLDDIPDGFAMAGDADDPDGHTVMYLRTGSVGTEAVADGAAFGITVNLNALPDVVRAKATLAELEATSVEAMVQDIRATSDSVTDAEVERTGAVLPGADEAVAYRVHYTIGTTTVYEQRFRFRVRNVVGNLIVSSHASGGAEPAGLERQAVALAARQVERLIAMRQ